MIENLFDLKNKYWISVSPLARAKDECWVVSVYKKQKISWMTEECNSFPTPEQAYEWGFNEINSINKKKEKTMGRDKAKPEREKKKPKKDKPKKVKKKKKKKRKGNE